MNHLKMKTILRINQLTIIPPTLTPLIHMMSVILNMKVLLNNTKTKDMKNRRTKRMLTFITSKVRRSLKTRIY